METIADQIRIITDTQIDKFNKDLKYNEFRDYFEKMKTAGLINPGTYTLPPLDTIGKRLYNSK